MLSPDLALICHEIWQVACAKWKKKRLFWGLDRHFQWHHEVTQKVEKCGKVQTYIRVNKLPPRLYKVRITTYLVSQTRWSNGLGHRPKDEGIAHCRRFEYGRNEGTGGNDAHFLRQFSKKYFSKKNLLVVSFTCFFVYFSETQIKQQNSLYSFNLGHLLNRQSSSDT